MVNPNRAQVYLEGWEAHTIGIDFNDNPYDLESQLWAHLEWFRGWIEHAEPVKFVWSFEPDADFSPLRRSAARSG